MTDTANLGLPCIEGSQAQKHVTHNEALRILDTLVQLAVKDRDLTAPPGSPVEGDRYIVKSGATGVWAGRVNEIAAWQDGVWQISAPRVGWLAYVIDEGALLAWNGSAWVDAIAALTSLNNMTLLGVGTTADATNPFSAKLNNVLFTAKTVAEGGDGHLRTKLSKESAVKTLSFLFQDNYSGRAEIGLTGDDDFHFKVSPDGSAWHEGIVIDRATGAVTFPNTTIAGGRELLTANRTYYVRGDGDDANNGLSNSAGGAFKTIAKAVSVVGGLDLSVFGVTIQLGAAGTYAGFVVSAPFVGGPGSFVQLQGDTGAPGSYVISSQITVQNNAGLLVKGVKFVSSDNGLNASAGATVTINGAVEFGATTSNHIYCQQQARVLINAAYSITGSAAYHIQCRDGGFVFAAGLTITISGTLSFTYVTAYNCGIAQLNSNTYTGSYTVTGARYSASVNGCILVLGAGATYLPGNSSGSTASGGQYS